MKPFLVRRATAEDAEGVKAVHITGWREAYGHVLPQEFLDDLENHIDVERWRRTLAGPDVIAYVATIATENPRIIGWATAGKSRESEAPAELELMGMYITSEWYGTGVAHELIQHAIGTQAAYLWVLKDNARAQAFYRKEGFELDGAEQNYQLGPSKVRITRMSRPE